MTSLLALLWAVESGFAGNKFAVWTWGWTEQEFSGLLVVFSRVIVCFLIVAVYFGLSQDPLD